MSIDDAIFDIEDYVGGNIEGITKIDRMGFTVFLRKQLTALISSEVAKAKIAEVDRCNAQAFADETVWEYLRKRKAALTAEVESNG